MDQAHTSLLHSLFAFFIKVTLAHTLEIIIDFLLSCVFSLLIIILVLRPSLIDLYDIVVINGILVWRVAVLPFLVEKLFVRFLADILVELV